MATARVTEDREEERTMIEQDGYEGIFKDLLFLERVPIGDKQSGWTYTAECFNFVWIRKTN